MNWLTAVIVALLVSASPALFGETKTLANNVPCSDTSVSDALE